MNIHELETTLKHELESAQQQVAEEKLSGNVVKEAYAKGMLSGLEIASILVSRLSA